MKLLTIRVVSVVAEPDMDGEIAYMTRRTTDAVPVTYYAPAGDVVSIEDEPAPPLPTEPGVRFWGKAEHLGGDKYDAQWWFVRENGAGVIFYAPTRTDQMATGVRADDVERAGLVRLPDPEVAS